MNSAFITVVSGTLVFVLGQLFLEIYLKPLSKYKKTKAEIIFYLYRYKRNIFNPIDYKKYMDYSNSVDVSDKDHVKQYRDAELRSLELAAELAEFLENRGICFLVIPKKRCIRDAIGALNLLSYGIINRENYNAIKENGESYLTIIKSLNLKGVENLKQNEKDKRGKEYKI